jgi:WD40 repeat protein
MSDNLFIGFTQSLGGRTGLKQWSVSKGEFIKEYLDIIDGGIYRLA